MEIQGYITILLSSNILLWLISFFVTRHFSKKDDIDELKEIVKALSLKDCDQDKVLKSQSKEIKTIKGTTGALTYKALSDLTSAIVRKNCASIGDRRVIKEINKAYKDNGYNGDFDEVIKIIDELPYE